MWGKGEIPGWRVTSGPVERMNCQRKDVKGANHSTKIGKANHQNWVFNSAVGRSVVGWGGGYSRLVAPSVRTEKGTILYRGEGDMKAVRRGEPVHRGMFQEIHQDSDSDGDGPYAETSLEERPEG